MTTQDICSAFRRNPDGSWTSIGSVSIKGPSGQVQVGTGMTFNRGVLFLGLDIAAWLDQNCGQRLSS